MKAILIKPATRSLEVVEISDLQSIYDALEVDLITCAGYDERQKNCLYVDDEGLFKQNPFFFYCPTFYPNPLAGNGLICGTNQMGETVDVTTIAEHLKVSFFDVRKPLDYMRLTNWGS